MKRFSSIGIASRLALASSFLFVASHLSAQAVDATLNSSSPHGLLTTVSNNSLNNVSGNGTVTIPSPMHSLAIQRRRDNSLAFGWQGSAAIRSLKVTLLNHARKAISQQSVEKGLPVVFSPNADTSNSCYYRVTVVYSDGAMAAAQGLLN